MYSTHCIKLRIMIAWPWKGLKEASGWYYFICQLASPYSFAIIVRCTRIYSRQGWSRQFFTFHNPLSCFDEYLQPGSIKKYVHIITINVPVVFMAQYVMILRGATSLRGALERVGPENRDFFGPWNGTSEASAIWAQSYWYIMKYWYVM